MKKNIYIFTNSYPYTKSVEVFIAEEMNVAAKMDCNIFIIPTNKDAFVRKVPENVTVLPCLTDISKVRKLGLLLSMPFSGKFWSMIKETGLTKKLLQGIKYLYGAYMTRYYIKRTIKSPSVLYSYWFSYTALGMAMSRDCNDILQKCTMVSRGHGYDVFADQRDIYIPHRNFTLSKIDMLCPVSDTGTSYLSGKYPAYAAKIRTQRLGIAPAACSKANDDNTGTISFVSCSAVYDLKRVDLIFNMIRAFAEKRPEKKVLWTHFGDGPMFEQLKHLCSDKPQNMTVSLKGFTAGNEIRRIYADEHFDIFVNMSTTEGIPVSIMEALSAGIPAIATDVGGNHEIVCEATGTTVPAEPTYEDFESAVNLIIKNKENFKSSTIEFFNKHYNAEKNYTDFYNTIMGL
ncbi:MAG: glycosyltransferase [Bacteroidales bacterium]|nr:glycosyltransferase [Bacteroidales bacterium]